jgi:hypothetical protein
LGESYFLPFSISLTKLWASPVLIANPFWEQFFAVLSRFKFPPIMARISVSLIVFGIAGKLLLQFDIPATNHGKHK